MSKTLLEILAEELTEWPEGFQRITQRAGGEVVVSSGLGATYCAGTYEVASDRETTVVTRAQWEAERAKRMNQSS